MYYLRGEKKLISTKPLAFSKMIWIFHDVFRMSEWKSYFREHIFINHVGPWTIILICVKQGTTKFDPFLWMRMTNIETKNPRRPNSSLQFKPTLPLSKKVLHNVSSISNFFLVLYGGNFSIVIEDSDSYSEVSRRKSWTFADIHNSKWKALRINLEKTQIPVADLFIEGFWRNWLCFFKAINYLCWKKNSPRDKDSIIFLCIIYNDNHLFLTNNIILILTNHGKHTSHEVLS